MTDEYHRQPMLWDEVEVDLDGVMLASGGVWLESVPHAVEAYKDKGLFKAEALKQGGHCCRVYRLDRYRGSPRCRAAPIGRRLYN